jgi:hypothetical protein
LEALARKQSNLCAICGKPETKKIHGFSLTLSVDHCHISGKVRGLLCAKCNQLIGLAGDNGDSLVVLQSALDYLKKHWLLIWSD